ncbi:MAG TPA: MFS transporter [Woeseiaceae bacterium]|nr:MFS transporter [Woeseiaceae bacterium]
MNRDDANPDDANPDDENPDDNGRDAPLLKRLFALEPRERSAVVWSFLYFFTLLCSYYLLRPIRDEMAILGGTENIRWLFLATFLSMLAVVPLFGYVTGRWPRARFLPWVNLFCAANLVVFYLAFASAGDNAVWVARAFFVWLSVFNLFVVSVFWSFMADLYDRDQAKRLFGIVAAGGSVGALTGPALTALLVAQIGYQQMLLISAALLTFTVVCILRLRSWAHAQPRHERAHTDEALGGGVLEGISLTLRRPYLTGVSAMMMLAVFAGTALYIFQAQFLEQAFADSNQRTRVFALVDLSVNVLALVAQGLVVGRVMRRFGLGITLALLPAVSIAGFLALAMTPVLGVVLALQVVRRAMNYGIAGPAKEVLFTVVSRAAKYKAKNFIDTVVYRGGDALSAQIIGGLQAAGAGLSAILAIVIGVCAAWLGVAFGLGRGYRTRYDRRLREERPITEAPT